MVTTRKRTKEAAAAATSELKRQKVDLPEDEEKEIREMNKRLEKIGLSIRIQNVTKYKIGEEDKDVLFKMEQNLDRVLEKREEKKTEQREKKKEKSAPRRFASASSGKRNNSVSDARKYNSETALHSKNKKDEENVEEVNNEEEEEEEQPQVRSTRSRSRTELKDAQIKKNASPAVRIPPPVIQSHNSPQSSVRKERKQTSRSSNSPVNTVKEKSRQRSEERNERVCDDEREETVREENEREVEEKKTARQLSSERSRRLSTDGSAIDFSPERNIPDTIDEVTEPNCTPIVTRTSRSLKLKLAMLDSPPHMREYDMDGEEREKEERNERRLRSMSNNDVIPQLSFRQQSPSPEPTPQRQHISCKDTPTRDNVNSRHNLSLQRKSSPGSSVVHNLTFNIDESIDNGEEMDQSDKKSVENIEEDEREWEEERAETVEDDEIVNNEREREKAEKKTVETRGIGQKMADKMAEYTKKLEKRREEEKREERKREEMEREEREREEEEREQREREKQRRDKEREEKLREVEEQEEKEREERENKEKEREQKAKEEAEWRKRLKEKNERDQKLKEEYKRREQQIAQQQREMEEKMREERQREEEEREQRQKEEKEREQRQKEEKQREQIQKEEKQREEKGRYEREKAEKQREEDRNAEKRRVKRRSSEKRNEEQMMTNQTSEMKMVDTREREQSPSSIHRSTVTSSPSPVSKKKSKYESPSPRVHDTYESMIQNMHTPSSLHSSPMQSPHRERLLPMATCGKTRSSTVSPKNSHNSVDETVYEDQFEKMIKGEATPLNLLPKNIPKLNDSSKKDVLRTSVPPILLRRVEGALSEGSVIPPNEDRISKPAPSIISSASQESILAKPKKKVSIFAPGDKKPTTRTALVDYADSSEYESEEEDVPLPKVRHRSSVGLSKEKWKETKDGKGGRRLSVSGGSQPRQSLIGSSRLGRISTVSTIREDIMADFDNTFSTDVFNQGMMETRRSGRRSTLAEGLETPSLGASRRLSTINDTSMNAKDRRQTIDKFCDKDYVNRLAYDGISEEPENDDEDNQPDRESNKPMENKRTGVSRNSRSMIEENPYGAGAVRSVRQGDRNSKTFVPMKEEIEHSNDSPHASPEHLSTSVRHDNKDDPNYNNDTFHSNFVFADESRMGSLPGDSTIEKFDDMMKDLSHLTRRRTADYRTTMTRSTIIDLVNRHSERRKALENQQGNETKDQLLEEDEKTNRHEVSMDVCSGQDVPTFSPINGSLNNETVDSVGFHPPSPSAERRCARRSLNEELLKVSLKSTGESVVSRERKESIKREDELKEQKEDRLRRSDRKKE